MRLMKDTVLYPFPGRMASCLKLTETEMSIYDVFIRYSVNVM